MLLADSKFYLRLILSLFLYTFSFLSKHCYTQLQWTPRHYCFVASSIRKYKSCACKLQCGTYLQPVEGKDQPALSGALRCRTLRICWREEGGRALQWQWWLRRFKGRPQGLRAGRWAGIRLTDRQRQSLQMEQPSHSTFSFSVTLVFFFTFVCLKSGFVRVSWRIQSKQSYHF